MNTTQQFDKEGLQAILEPIIRRIIREEFKKIVQQNPNIFFMTPEMPLYKDMEEISDKKREQRIEIFSHEEVWSE